MWPYRGRQAMLVKTNIFVTGSSIYKFLFTRPLPHPVLLKGIFVEVYELLRAMC